MTDLSARLKAKGYAPVSDAGLRRNMGVPTIMLEPASPLDYAFSQVLNWYLSLILLRPRTILGLGLSQPIQRSGVETGTLAPRRRYWRFFVPPPPMAGGTKQGLPLASRLVLVFHIRTACRPSVERCRQAL